MALSTPPQVQVDGGPWRDTEWTTALDPEDVQRGRAELPADGVEFFHWTVLDVEAGYRRVYRLRFAGPSAPASQAAGAILLTVGVHPTRTRYLTATEAKVVDTDPITVTAVP